MHIESIRAAAVAGASLLLAACAAQTPPDTIGGYNPAFDDPVGRYYALLATYTF